MNLTIPANVMSRIGPWKNLFKLVPFIGKHRLSFMFGVGTVLASSILTVPIPYLTGILLDRVLLKDKNINDMFLLLGMMAVLYLVQYAFSLLSGWLFVKISYSIINELKYSVMSKVLSLPMSYLSTTEKGYLQGRVAECNSVGNAFSPVIISMVLSVLNAMFAVITMFAINYKISCVVIVLVPVFIFLSKSSNKKFLNSTREMMESSAVLSGEVFESMNGIEDIKILGGKETQLFKFKSKMNELFHHSVKQNKSLIFLTENVGLLNNLFTLIILLISGILILKGQFTVGMYTSFSLYTTKVFASAQSITSLNTILKPVCLSVERIYQLLDMEDENSGKVAELDSRIETIEFLRVGYRYRTDLPLVFNDLTFSFMRGDKVLLLGDNGTGKTTLIKLLLGLYQPAYGTISFNGIHASSIQSDSLRQRIGVVSQSTFLFRGTVLDNILYGQNCDRSTVENLIDELGLKEYIDRMPKGLDTEINQNTSGVSGGQAQIIAFIRAMLAEKDVLILDEPTANVDEETRRIIIHSLREQRYMGILIVISHQMDGMDFFNKTIHLTKTL
ncbi:ABC transporter ATP-binding protein [Paenibacillus sp. OAE614]|uniref:ABC transporter ATP-binding protein n=1 Tax=Paenibacillus sp. OAE614 TaxID=2663804 RepID=UPI001A07C939